jgi:uncharacterized membrane protein
MATRTGSGARREEPPALWESLDTRAFLLGAAAGTGLAYFLDERSGRRRRKLVADRFVRVVNRSDDAVGKVMRDARNRLSGVVALTERRVRPGPATDAALEARVRQTIQRTSSHPGAIEVHAEGGRVTIAGPVLDREARGIAAAVRRTPGVEEVEDRMRPADPETEPSLQGVPRIRRRRQPWIGDSWPPAVRAAAGLVGGALAAYGAWRRDPAGALLGFVGIGLAGRAASNRRLTMLTGISAGRDAVDLHKTINLDAPRKRAFELWTDYQRLPDFMRHVREVKDLGGGRTRWVVHGPLGTEIGWDAETVKVEPERELAWRTVPGSLIQHAGAVTFRDNPEGGTQVNVHFAYNPAIGAAGHLLTQVLGADPKREMDEDLMRMKSMLATGRRPARAARSGG